MRLDRDAGSDPKGHFLGIRKMVDLGSGAKCEIEDIALTARNRCQGRSAGMEARQGYSSYE